MKQGLCLVLDDNALFAEFGGSVPGRDPNLVLAQALSLADGGAYALRIHAISATFTDDGDFLHFGGTPEFEVVPSEIPNKHGYKPSTGKAEHQIALDELLDIHLREIDDYKEEIKKKALSYYREHIHHRPRNGLILFYKE